MLCYTILYYIILYYTILYYTILYYTILYYTTLHYTTLYCTVLFYVLTTIKLYTIKNLLSVVSVLSVFTKEKKKRKKTMQLCRNITEIFVGAVPDDKIAITLWVWSLILIAPCLKGLLLQLLSNLETYNRPICNRMIRCDEEEIEVSLGYF